MTNKIRIQRWAVGLALASTCVLVATAQVKTAEPVAAPIAEAVVDDIPFAPANVQRSGQNQEENEEDAPDRRRCQSVRREENVVESESRIARGHFR